MSSSKIVKKSLAEIVDHLYPPSSSFVVNNNNGQQEQQYNYGNDVVAAAIDDKEDGQCDASDMEETEEDLPKSFGLTTAAAASSTMPPTTAIKLEVSNENVSTVSMSPPHVHRQQQQPSSSHPSTAPPTPAISDFDPRTLDPTTLAFITSIITAAASANSISLSQLLAAAPLHLQQPSWSSATTNPSTNNTFDFAAAIAAQQQQSNLFSSFASSSSTPSASIPATSSSSNSTFLLPYIVPKSSLTANCKKRINRGRAFKAHKGIYNVIIDGQVRSADCLIDTLRTEMAKKQAELPPIIVEGTNVCEKLSQTIDLLPHLNNPSHCGAVVAGHLFPRDFFVDHILRDVEGNVKAAKGFINHSNREPLSPQASKLFFDILYYYGGAIVEPDMLESWMWVARKGVNDRGNTSKSGRGVRYFVKADYVSILQNDIWAAASSEKSS